VESATRIASAAGIALSMTLSFRNGGKTAI
jgi:hypothetical protein